jgi:hydrogen peroxide-dependent heme synthase
VRPTWERIVHNPFVPETLEGWGLLHQTFRIRWAELRRLSAAARTELAAEAVALMRTSAGGDSAGLIGPADASVGGDSGRTALVQVLGHKGDLMLIHARRTFDDLSQAQLDVAQARLFDHLEPTTSYVSIVELGMYEMTAKIHEQLAEKGMKLGGDEYEAAYDAAMEVQKSRVMSRLYIDLPERRHVCFYPMNKRRGEIKNWYTVSFEERAAMMREHGHIGRGYAGKVTQIISGSIGLDDWEWGVDLFADDPNVFKKLIYEMRFDRASADYAEFGPFYVGLQFAPSRLADLLDGRTPQLVQEVLA